MTIAMRGASALAMLALTACTTFSQDGGFGRVAESARTRLGKDVRWVRTPEEKAARDQKTVELLKEPLSVDGAVQIALLNNGALQASFEELGIAEADLVRSGRLPNPRFSLRRTSAGGLYDIEETVTVNVLSLVSMPYVHRAEQQRFAETQTGALAAVAELAASTREAYFTALAAHESAQYLEKAKSAGEAGAELARRMRAAGNWNRLDESRERAFYLDSASAYARAQALESGARERLSRLMGATGDTAGFKLAEHLPELPARIEDLGDVERTALDNRIDLERSRAQLAALAENLKLTRASRFVDVLEAGPARVRQGSSGAPYESGFEVSFEVPIFDGGEPRLRKAEAIYAQALDGLAQAAIDARAEVREAYAQYRAAYEIAARERDEVLPMRKAIAEEDLRRYDAAQIGVFDLLADARAEMTGVSDSIQSVCDFWIAKSRLDTALIGRSLPR